MLAVAAAVALLLAAATALDTVATVIRLHSALPYFDEWDDLDLLRSILDRETPVLAGLFTQHNEHRILFPRLILYADDFLFGGRGLLDRSAIFLIQAAQAAMLIGLARRAWPRPRLPLRRDPVFLAFAALAVLLLFSLRQEENFSWSFQVQFVAIFALATSGALLFAAALDREIRGGAAWPWFLAAYGTAAVATFTMANGILTAVVLVVLAALWRARSITIVTSLSVAAVLAAAYLHGYEAHAAHTPLREALAHPLRLASYVAIYLGNFLSPNLVWSRLLGLVGLLGLALAVLRALVLPDRSPARLALLGVMLFVAGTAIITALGRVGFGLDQATSSRYSTGSAAFWVAALAYGVSLRAVVRWPAPLRGVLALAALILAAGAIHAQGAMKPDMEHRAYEERMTADALLLDLRDEDTFGNVDDDTAVIEALSKLLKARGWSVFGERDATLLGRPIADAGPLADGADCRGSFGAASAKPVFGRDAVSVAGQAWALHHKGWSGRVYIADATDRLVGLATRRPPTDDPAGWTGYARVPPDAALRAYAELGDGALCPLGERSVAPSPQ